VKLKTPIYLTLLLMISSCVTHTQTIGIPINANLPNSVASNPSIDNWVVRLDLESLETLSLSSDYYLLYLGNPSCSSCIRFQPNLITWIDETNALVYYLDTLENLHQLPMIQNQFPQYFPEGFSTPTLYLFLETNRVHRLSASEAFFSYPRFKALMANYVHTFVE